MKSANRWYARLEYPLMLITIGALALRGVGLVHQPLTADDAAVAASAVNYVQTGHLGPTMWNHPHLRDILTYLSLSLCGGGIWGLKLPSLLLGTLSVPLVGMVGAKLSGSATAGILAALFLAIDPLHIDFSRQAIQEVHMAFFALAGVFFALLHLERRRTAPLLLSGICFGLGCASKWYVAFSLLATFAWFLYRGCGEGLSEKKRDWIFFVIAALVALPVLVYLLTFLPWFQRGYGIGEWLTLQWAMFVETGSHSGYSPYDLELGHRAYLWFVKPAAFADLAGAEEQLTVLIGISNPFTWLLTIPAMTYLARAGRRDTKREQRFLCALFMFSYLPLVLTNRPIWAHTAFAVLPFAFIAVGWFLTDMADKGLRHRQFLALYLTITIIASIPLYLLATGLRPHVGLFGPVIEKFRPLNER